MNNIRIELRRKNKTIAWLAKEINKSYNMTISYVNNKRQPSIETLFAIAHALKIKPSYLINNYYEN